MKKDLLDDICSQLKNLYKTNNPLVDSLQARYGEALATMLKPDLTERASRLHTELRCRQVAGRYPDGKIIMPDETTGQGIVKGDYRFVRRDRNRTTIDVFQKNSHDLEGEIELMMRINGEYVIVETHVGKYKPGNKGIGVHMRLERVNRILNYGESFAGKRPSMIMVIAQEQMGLGRVAGSNIGKFLASGGRIVPFYTTRDQWQRDIDAIKRTYESPKIVFSTQ